MMRNCDRKSQSCFAPYKKHDERRRQFDVSRSFAALNIFIEISAVPLQPDFIRIYLIKIYYYNYANHIEKVIDLLFTALYGFETNRDFDNHDG